MIGDRTNSLLLKTPEGISFSIPLAGPMTRFLALIIDICCVSTLLYFAAVAAQILGFFLEGLGGALMAALAFVATVGYGIFFEWFWRGQTIGKRLLRLRVIDERGLRLQFSQVVLRNLLRVADQLPLLYLLGGVVCVINGKNQRLGDIAAGTVVTRVRRQSATPETNLGEEKYNSFRDHPHIEARLRQNTPSEEAALAAAALLRRDELDPDARLRVFEELAEHFRAHANFPEEAAFGLTDEQYVRNIVETLNRAPGQR